MSFIICMKTGMDTYNIEKKWIKKWEESKIFQPEVNHKKKKFMLTFPYPYVNAYPHIGHFYTIMRVDAFARYKRMRGYNVLFPQGWHATGSPIINAAKRIKEKEEKQWKIMKDMGFSDVEIKKFEDPEYWVEYFVPEFKKDFTVMGLSIDWRREFITTSLNPHYDKFIRWQFNKLKEKGYVVQGEFPVVWCPKERCPVGDHSRIEGEGEVPQEFILVKHQFGKNTYIVSATLRQDTILGITNLYVHPNIKYVKADVNDEKWIISRHAAENLAYQNYNVKIVEEIDGKHLIGKKVKVFGGREVLVLPAVFLESSFGTGLVHSVPSDSADDLIALKDLQKDDALIKKYNLDPKEVMAIKPIPVLDTPGFGDLPAVKMLEKYNITSQQQKEKLQKAKEELYKLSYYQSTFKEKYNGFFKCKLSGMKVEQGKEIIKEELIKKGIIALYYQLTGKVVCRCLTQSIVKIVDDQWFIAYSDEKWKKQAHNILENVKLYPEKSREQFEHVIEWLRNWACTREEGLGTRIPWDEKWLIESLSDSTIYNAYYTLMPYIEKINPKELTDELFDYILLGESKKNSNKNKLKVDKDILSSMKESFEYWYPTDFRNSGKDLVQNHLTFYLFHHTAIFPKNFWPKGIGVNGWVTVNGQKMSKSLGNMIPLREMPVKYGVDASRLTILSGGEGLDDANWDSSFAERVKLRLPQLHSLIEQYGKGRKEWSIIDDWMESVLNSTIKKTTEACEETMFRTAVQFGYFDMQNSIKWYLKRTKNNPNKELMKKIIEVQLLLLAPFTPFICEELWEKLGKKKFIGITEWPEYVDNKINPEYETQEDYIKTLLDDIRSVLTLVENKGMKPNTVSLVLADQWKVKLFMEIQKIMIKTRNPVEIIKEISKNVELKKYMQDITKLLPQLIKGKIHSVVLSSQKEKEVIKDSLKFLESEFSLKFSIIDQHEKKKYAIPGKPAIIVE